MKKVFFAIAIVTASFAANAQNSGASEGFKVGAGLRVGLPVGEFGDVYGFALGAEVQGEYKFSPMVSGTITTGYTRFMGKTIGGFEIPSTGIIPILAGVRVYPSTQFFVGGRLGLSLSTEEGGGSDFTYEPQIGYNGQRFQLALGYNAISGDGSTAGHIGLTGIIKFN